MKLLSVLIAVLMMAVLFTSCKKDKTSATTRIEGNYSGKWGDVVGDPHSFFSFQIKQDGTLIRINEQGLQIATGTWILSGNNFEATYTHTNGEKHSIGGLYTAFDGQIMGTWGYGNSKAGGGTFFLIKQ